MNQQHQQDNQEYIAFLDEVWQATSDSNKDYQGQIKKVLPSLCLEAFPFAKPFYWAGFICSGLS